MASSVEDFPSYSGLFNESVTPQDLVQRGSSPLCPSSSACRFSCKLIEPTLKIAVPSLRVRDRADNRTSIWSTPPQHARSFQQPLLRPCDAGWSATVLVSLCDPVWRHCAQVTGSELGRRRACRGAALLGCGSWRTTPALAHAAAAGRVGAAASDRARPRRRRQTVGALRLAASRNQFSVLIALGKRRRRPLRAPLNTVIDDARRNLASRRPQVCRRAVNYCCIYLAFYLQSL